MTAQAAIDQPAIDQPTRADGPVHSVDVQPTPNSPAGDVLAVHLAEQVAAMRTREQDAREDEPDGVHKMRVATRRLRSALATFRPLLNRTVTDPLRDELKWIAAALGGARDAEVLRIRLLDELAAEPDDLVLRPVAARVESELRDAHRKAHADLLVALDSARYAEMVERLDAMVADPPFAELAAAPAGPVLTKRVRRSFKRVKALVEAGPPPDLLHRAERSEEWYHEIRKASKRLRYAAESVAPTFGAPATELAESAEDLQEILGEHQDSVVARAALRQLGVRIHLDGDNAFTIGRLHALEQAKGDNAVRQFDAAWTALSDKKIRRWLR